MASDAAKARSETSPSNHGEPTTDDAMPIKAEEENGGNDDTNGVESDPHANDDGNAQDDAQTAGSTTATPEATDKLNRSKRKRGPSPPWKSFIAETSTLNVDGRRLSARVNSSLSTPGVSSDNESRGRKSISRASPPWKAFGAESASVINVDGRRKSGRVNRELAESKSQSKSGTPNQKKATTNGNAKMSSAGKNRKVDVDRNNDNDDDTSAERPSMSTSTNSRIAELQAKIAALQPTRSFPAAEDNESKAAPQSKTAPSKRPHKRKASQNVKTEDQSGSPPRSRKAPRQSNAASLSPEQSKPTPRIRLRFQGNRKAVPPHHPHAISKPAFPPQLALNQVIEDWELQELQQPFLENDRGPPDAEYFVQRAIRQAAEEGVMRQRIFKEAESGGALSKENLSLYQADRQQEPPQPVAHHDQLAAHALYLRQLQIKEKVQHRLLAKKIAFEALDKWKTRNGPTEEDIVAEQDRMFRLVAKQVIADMSAKWALVEAHVQEAKKKAYEIEQGRIQAQKLQEKLEYSENLLAKQRGDADSDVEMEVDAEGSDEPENSASGSDADSGEDDEDNISESEDEDDGNASEDEGDMDAEALAAYKAHQAELAEKQHSEPPDKVLDGGEEGEQVAQAEALRDPQIAEKADEETVPAEEDTQMDDAESQVDDADATEMHTRNRAQASRSVSATVEEIQAEDHLSSDDSTNMDSEDYDSDEDMTTGDEANGDENDNDDEESEAEEEPSILGFYRAADLPTLREKDGGLPTPMTSVENGGEDEHPRSGSEAVFDGQASAGADQGRGLAKEQPMPQISTPAADEDEQQPEKPIEETDAGNEDRADHADNADNAGNADKSANEAHIDAAMEADTAETVEDLGARARVPIPSLMRGTLRSYQHAGLDWLASLYRNRTNGILADEMGLGKTIQTISLLAHLAEVHHVWDTHLVIVPTSVILNWVTEFHKFLPGFRVLAYYGTLEERALKRRGWAGDPHHENKEKRGYNVIITSYNIAMQDINSLRQVSWHYLILDEAHNIRNFNSQRWQTLIRLRTRARLLLTGTPLQNDLAEVWALLTFLTAGDDERSHGKLEEFLGHWKDPVKEIFDQGVQKISESAQRVVDQLHVSLRPFLLRRKKNEVEKDLPKKTEHVVVCKLSKRQRQLYQDYMGLAETKASLAKGNGVQAGAVLLSLRRVCNHPDLFDPRPIQTSFAMETSPIEIYSVKEQLVRQLLGVPRDTPAKFLIAAREGRKRLTTQRARRLDATHLLQRQVVEVEALTADTSFDPATVIGSRALQRLQLRQRKLNQLRACIQATESSFAETPVYGTDLRQLVTINKRSPYTCVSRWQPSLRGLRAWPTMGKKPMLFEHPIDWTLIKNTRLQADIATYDSLAESMKETLVRFTFVPPAVTVPILDYAIPPRLQDSIRMTSAYPTESDFGHEARVRASIAFPDSRLLIYDSGKLQRLTYLLRELQSKGSRSLIFTQMVGTLNILEQFLSLMNLPYLRLDGNTSVERRALMAAEFNRPDSKYQCMILSSRAGGVGLNLTGASSVIFYDLDWNPQMDRQCMDRAHRIGQVRDVGVYKMVSEKTVEENILRRANQKSLLDQTVIQDGHFTTEYQLPSRREEEAAGDKNDEVGLAIDRFLGGEEKSTTQALESVEDKEDVAAAQQARKEDHQDDMDFDRSKDHSKANTPGPGGNAGGVEEDEVDAALKGHVDSYMIRLMEEILLKGWIYVPPPIRRLDKHGRDPSHRPKRKR